MTEISLSYYGILLITGLAAGFINTLAGGGSNLTLPALMLTGMPADIANATNRVGIFLQCLVGIKGYKKHNKIDSNDLLPVLLPTIIGGGVGAFLAAILPVSLLKPLLLSAMIGVAILIVFFPSIIAPDDGTPTYKVSKRPSAWIALFVTGIYGGFVQAGVGFLLIAALAGTLRYDLVKSNALKLVCTLAFTSISLLIFIADDLVRWIPGLALAVGTMAGAAMAVRISLTISQRTMKWFLLIMTVVASAAAMFL